jgi:hypothetical protein
MLSRLIDRSVTTLSVPSTNSFLRAVSAEGRTLDGHRGHIIIVDELHEHPNELVLAKLRASVKGRRQPLVLSITNAGHDRTSVCWQQHAYGLQVLDGVAPNDSHFVYICQHSTPVPSVALKATSRLSRAARVAIAGRTNRSGSRRTRVSRSRRRLSISANKSAKRSACRGKNHSCAD